VSQVRGIQKKEKKRKKKKKKKKKEEERHRWSMSGVSFSNENFNE